MGEPAVKPKRALYERHPKTVHAIVGLIAGIFFGIILMVAYQVIVGNLNGSLASQILVSSALTTAILAVVFPRFGRVCVGIVEGVLSNLN